MLPSLVTEIVVVASRPRAIRALAIAGALSSELITTIVIVVSKCRDQSIGSEPFKMLTYLPLFAKSDIPA